MKLERTEEDSIDLVQEELEYLKQSDEEFWQSIRELMKYGVPSYDNRGHFSEVRVKVRPLQIDMIAAVREKMPEGWFKNMASLHRSILAVGCKVILRLVNSKAEEWHEILDGLNQMAKKARLEEFKKDMTALRGNIIECDTMPPEEKLRVVDLMNKLESRFLAI